LHASFLERCGLLDCLSHGFLMEVEAEKQVVDSELTVSTIIRRLVGTVNALKVCRDR
jgi:hypothetical protein